MSCWSLLSEYRFSTSFGTSKCSCLPFFHAYLSGCHERLVESLNEIKKIYRPSASSFQQIRPAVLPQRVNYVSMTWQAHVGCYSSACYLPDAHSSLVTYSSIFSVNWRTADCLVVPQFLDKDDNYVDLVLGLWFTQVCFWHFNLAFLLTWIDHAFDLTVTFRDSPLFWSTFPLTFVFSVDLTVLEYIEGYFLFLVVFFSRRVI